MSKLEQLIEELCPDGVEYRALGELGKFYGGLTGKSKDDFTDGNAAFITYKNVYSNPALDIDPKDTVKIGVDENQRALEYGDVVFTGSSETPNECGFSAVVTKTPEKLLYLNSFCFFLRFHDLSGIEPDFLKHLFRSYDLRYQIGKTASGVTRFNVSKEKMSKIIIPLPPLSVQREIVRILDNFTELTAELTAELTDRKKQYEYYIENLLNSSGDITMETVGDIFSTVTDYVAAGSFASIAENVSYKNDPDFAQLVRTMDIKSAFTKGNNVYVDKTAFDFLWRVNLDKESIIMPNIGVNCGEVYYVKPEQLPYENNVLGPNAILLRSDRYNNKYLYYLLTTHLFQKALKVIISPGGQTKFNKTGLKNLKLPIPYADNLEKSLAEQERIVGLLDRFDTLCNDISKGLPAEIESRQQQYEYYRDKLLTFKNINAEV